MSNVKLPAKVRVGIRDAWDDPKCPLQKSINALKDVIGAPFNLIIDWGMVWTVLSPQYPDPNTFVPSLEDAVRVWAECLQERLESDALEDWIDEFLEKAKQSNGVAVEIGISDNKADRPEAVWDDSIQRLRILFPKGMNEKVYRNTLQAGFSGDLEHLFNKKSALAPASVTKLPIGGAGGPSVVDDGWNVIPPTSGPASGPTPTPAPGVVRQVAPTAPERFPVLATLERPEILFSVQTPYLIYVRKYGEKELHIEGSHHPSLTLICEYFQKWVRTDRNYNGNLIEFEKQTSMFGLNTGFDYVKISCNRWEMLNPTPFLAFIEIVLKYELVESSSGSTWFYRRDTKFI
ncbi:hypothetical protein AA313_de0205956 [Arthrobotrys entomopaga]|nr:hypothetical protein AA313_de0205956 [Arthrobotrys entomopaga]